MRRLVVIAMVMAVGADARDRRCRNTRAGERLEDACAGYAFFEAFPNSGAGTFGVCGTTAPTGAKGETLTFTRGSNGTCTKTATGGLATTGIANGDLVVLSNNQPRVEYDSQGVLGLLVESSRQNVLVRYIEYANAAWADVGTPTLTGSQTDPFGTTTAVQFDDNDGAAYEGRSQSVTVSAGAAYTAHCYVKAGTLAEARITLDGTANTITGLSATTWSVIEVTDASSSGVSIAFQALNGDATGDTGTVIWGGCQVEAGSYRTSIIPTTSAAVTRSEEAADFALTFSPTVGMCSASSMNVPTTSVWAAGSGTMSPIITKGAAGAALDGTLYFWPFSTAVGGALANDTAGVISAGQASYQPGVAATTQGRYFVRHPGGASNWTICTNASCTTSGVSSTWGTPSFTRVKVDRATAAAANAVAHIISRVQIDPDSTRCTP